MTEIECPGFSELVKCEMDGEYKIAQGWTTSTGQGGRFPYTVAEGWKFDPRFSDIEDPRLGTHGGCPDCIMTLVHLITIDPAIVEVEEDEWYDVFVDNAGYFLFFAIAGLAINEMAK